MNRPHTNEVCVQDDCKTSIDGGKSIKPESAGNYAWVVAARLALAGNDLIATSPIGTAFGLPFDVSSIGFAEDFRDVGVLVEMKDATGNMQEDGDLAHP